eukprot:CAMPEP_0178991932 /NCGR_PEP_ID=MMETSP0795-20121207/5818_1 /TAXON_ID=88552 /ORGANISM="Amoebophrya sp., Strain Ameob2" /LENGTH=413 /DNA_ID=CAMNT_0020683727 /DNA_START=485 /DNA_END=1726 /DNA_ORIENTATION=+
MASGSSSASGKGARFADRGFVVITGAAGNFGAAMAKRVIEEGGSVLLIDTPALTKPLEALRDYLSDRALKVARFHQKIKMVGNGASSGNLAALSSASSGGNLVAAGAVAVPAGGPVAVEPLELAIKSASSSGSTATGPPSTVASGGGAPSPVALKPNGGGGGAAAPGSTTTTTAPPGQLQARAPTPQPQVAVVQPQPAHPAQQVQPRVLMFMMDVRIDSEVEKLEQFLSSEQLWVYGLFNNAGIQGEISPIYETTVQDFENVIQVNVVGAFKVLRCVTKYMKDRGMKGAVVSTSSTAWNGVPNMIGYSMSKAAVVGMTGSAAKDLAPYGIRVNAISPGHVGGTMWDRKLALQATLKTQYWPHGDAAAVGEAMLKKVPQRRFADVNEITNVVAFLLSDEASFMTGENVRVAGGE